MKKNNKKLKNNINKRIKYFKYSIIINIKTWFFYFISIYILVPKNITNGILTFIIFYFIVYYFHYISHHYENILTIMHQYHHNNNNLFSNILEILLELLLCIQVLLINYLLNGVFNYWIIIFIYFFYTLVHNINYSLLKVNDTHKNHHKNKYTNFGPDIFDILCNTKYKLNFKSIENTDHYIPIIIISLLIVLILKYYYNSCINKSLNN